MAKNQSVPAASFSKGYWDRPTLDEKARGDTDVNLIFHAVGLALTQWESAECALATLFLVMSEVKTANSANAVRRAFGSIESSSGRRKALEATAEIYFAPFWTDPVVKKAFNALMKAFEEGSRRRDEIAHGMAYSVTVNNEPYGAFLFPPEYNTQRTFPFIAGSPDTPLALTRAKYRYSSVQILQLANKFDQLRNNVWDYVPRIKKIEGIPAIFLDAKYGEGAAQKAEEQLAERKA